MQSNQNEKSEDSLAGIDITLNTHNQNCSLLNSQHQISSPLLQASILKYNKNYRIVIIIEYKQKFLWLVENFFEELTESKRHVEENQSKKQRCKKIKKALMLNFVNSRSKRWTSIKMVGKFGIRSKKKEYEDYCKFFWYSYKWRILIQDWYKK